MDRYLPAMDVITKLIELDKWLFVRINSGFTNGFFDTVFPFFRDSIFWVPLYLFIFVFISINFGVKGWLWTLAFLCTVALTDLTGTYVFKENVQRLRPCQDPFFFHEVRLVIKKCSGGYSFLSNHAANHFGLATFITVTFSHYYRPWIYGFYLWAFAIAYAQVYVGVHFPSDVLAGAVIGILFGWMTGRIYNKNVGFISLEK